MIEVRHLSKTYGTVTAVDDISFRVAHGEILGFLGPNGAGKTTTMRILTGYIPPTEGEVIVAGFNVFDNPIEAKRRTGYLPETPPLYPEMTVREFLTFVAQINNIARADRRRLVITAMERTWVTDMADRHCATLSKGYRQRVGLAQAILHNPEVLILDEPTAGLDPKQIIETRELIKELAGDHTIILSTHILPEVSQTCQRVVIISRGHVVAENTPENLTALGQDVTTVRLRFDTQDMTAPATLASIPGVLRVTTIEQSNSVTTLDVETEHDHDLRRDLARTIVANGWGLLELRSMQISLEDVFLHLTTEEQDEGSTILDESSPPEQLHHKKDAAELDNE